MVNQVVLYEATSQRWLYFREPRHVIEVTHLNEVVTALRRVEDMVNQRGWYAAGFISYEAAPAFDPALKVRPVTSFPLLWFGLYPPPEPGQLAPPAAGLSEPLVWTPAVSRAEYDQAIARIKTCIAQGQTYQVNYTMRLHTPFTGDPWPFFGELARAQQAAYAAYLDTGRFVICSASPELFFQLDGRHLVSKPMKGTARRGLTLADDEAQADWLRQSEKNRAENVMIVDMIRNDMGRIAAIGSVQVPHLFTTERYPTLWQMTSTVVSATDASLSEIMAALFPCASITGAPKPRTMQFIAELEPAPRRIYTGCIGFIAPQRQAQFNVAIRTVLIDRLTGQAEYGVGGGIVWDSVSGEEYTECQLKAQVLTTRRPDFALLETMLWTPAEGYFLLDYHLRRLHDSAIYFGFPVELDRVQQKLADLAASLPWSPQRVRLLVTSDGAITCQAMPLDNSVPPQAAQLKLAVKPVDTTNPFLYHKTTQRQVYENARAACADCDDVLLWNERGEITESCIANIVVEVAGKLVTPPVQCGLLAGTFRAWLLDRGEVREQVIPLDILKRNPRLYLINSVRKWREAFLVA